MTRVLATGVRVQDSDGHHVIVGPGACPGWAVEQITNDAAWVDDGVPDPEVPDVGGVVGEAPVEVGGDASEGDDADVDNEPAQGGEGGGDTAPGDEGVTTTGSYDHMTASELREEVARRNEHRADDDQVTVGDARVKADLIAALESDDAFDND